MMFLRRIVVRNCVRYYSYKPIKRANLNELSNKAFVEKKLKEYDIAKVLRSQIEVSGPLTGDFFTVN